MLIEPKNVEDLCSKIEYLLDRKDLRIEMGINGRKKVEIKYDWPIIVKKLEKTYRSLTE